MPVFTDTGFLCDVMIHCVGEQAEQKAPRQFKGAIAAARSLAQRILDRIGGTITAPGGGKSTQQQTRTKDQIPNRNIRDTAPTCET